jgi:phospholipid-binding lipoprotein MlaA
MNRGVFAVNRGVDWALVDPLTSAYAWLVPEPGRRAVRRFFDNLASPAVLVNDLLQLEGRRAARTGGRFLVNTTVGVGGLFDPAERLGLRRHEADFGQTLYTYGVGSGPYLMLPLLGPSSVRDATGRLVDGFLRIDLWLLGAAQIIVLGVADGVSLREMHEKALEELERSSVDYYAALRGVYWASRREFLEGAQPDAAHPPLAEALEAGEEAREGGEELEEGGGSEPPPPGPVPDTPAEPQVDSEGPSPRAYDSIFSRRSETSPSKPSRSSTVANSERRRATSLTVPFRYTSMMRQASPSRRSR